MVSKAALLLALFAAVPTVAALQVSMSDKKLSPMTTGSVVRRGFLQLGGSLGATAASAAFVSGNPAAARAEYKGLPEGRSVPADQRERGRGPAGVNKPELLPTGPTSVVIDLEKFMVPSAVARLETKIKKLEADTGVRVRVLTQAYPNTPGLAIKDYWQVDGKTIVMVVDRGAYQVSSRQEALGIPIAPALDIKGKSGTQVANILNFNVGPEVELTLPPVFFSRLRLLFGSNKFVKDQGEDGAIEAAVDTIASCLRSEGGCAEVPDEFRALANQKLNKPAKFVDTRANF